MKSDTACAPSPGARRIEPAERESRRAPTGETMPANKDTLGGGSMGTFGDTWGSLGCPLGSLRASKGALKRHHLN